MFTKSPKEGLEGLNIVEAGMMKVEGVLRARSHSGKMIDVLVRFDHKKGC